MRWELMNCEIILSDWDAFFYQLHIPGYSPLESPTIWKQRWPWYNSPPHTHTLLLEVSVQLQVNQFHLCSSFIIIHHQMFVPSAPISMSPNSKSTQGDREKKSILLFLRLGYKSVGGVQEEYIEPILLLELLSLSLS